MALLVSGAVPNTILENARPGDWQATLALTGPDTALAVELTGAHANLFEAELDRLSGRITILPAMVFDREAYTSSTDPVFQFGLRVQLDSGWQPLAQSWSVTLLGLEDAPPRRVFFATGGFVLESDIGAEIGRLQGSDPDTATSKLTYAVAGQDAWFFEIVSDNVLKLRDGVDLLRQGGTIRQVQIEVSDGFHEASFLLDVEVLNTTDVDTTPAPPPVEVPEEEQGPGTTNPDPTDPGTTDPDPTYPNPTDPSPTDPGPTDPGPGDPGTPGPGEGPADGGTAPVPPAPVPPVEALHIEAWATASLAGGLQLVWQAEQTLHWATGETWVTLASGQAAWMPPDTLLPELAAGWAATGTTQPEQRLLAEMLAGTIGAIGIAPWLARDSGETALTTLVRDFLARQDPAHAAWTDGQVLALLAGTHPGQTLVGDGFSFHLSAAGSPAGESALPSAGPGTAHSLLIASLFDTLLDRAPDAGETAHWRAELASGALDAEGLAHRLAQSTESLTRHGAQSDAAYAASLYDVAFGGMPDAAMLAHWTALLGTQALDRADLALAVAQDSLAAALQGNDPFAI